MNRRRNMPDGFTTLKRFVPATTTVVPRPSLTNVAVGSRLDVVNAGGGSASPAPKANMPKINVGTSFWLAARHRVGYRRRALGGRGD